MLSDAEFALVAREVKARSGAVLAPEISGAAEMRLQPLARREEFASVAELIAAARIRPDGRLWNGIAESLALCDTRFFRDRATFEALRQEIIPAAFARRDRIRIWSAACATGQEPYSVAMILDELRNEGMGGSAEIVATDFSERLIEKARSGLYTQFEVQRGLPIRKLIAHFEKAGELWRISDRLRAAIRFETHNLLKHPGALGQFDIILLRHVLPAFDIETKAAIVHRAAELLEPGGCILLGAGETPPTGCESLTFANGIITRGSANRRAA